MREEHRLKVFDSMVLRRICVPKRDEVTREWRKLHNEELKRFVPLTQYYRGGQIEKNEMDRACRMY